MSILIQASVPVRAKVYDPTDGWAGQQGAEWATRNPQNVKELDATYRERYGVTRTELNEWALGGVPRTASVLEVGCSAGAMLSAMGAVGFTKLEGCDVSADALRLCPWPSKLADGRALPYESGSFDLVMTSGTLMQIAPEFKALFMAECYRVAKRWIYGVEGASEDYVQWKFGSVIPDAWTAPYPECVLVPGWQIVRSRWLHQAPGADGNKKISLRAYLLERE